MTGEAVASNDVVSTRVLTVPNVISLVRLLLVPVFALLIVRGQDGWAVAVLAVSGASDWLDGVLARRLGQVSRLGQLLDPAADRLFIIVTLVALAWSGVVPWWLLGVLVLRDVVLAVMLVVLARAGYAPLQVHLAGKAGTFALLYAFPLLLLAQWDSWVGTVAGVVGWAFALWGVALYWFSAAVYLTQARHLLRAAGGRRHEPAARVRRRPPETQRSPDASMTLLTEVYRRPLDPGYAEAAARRAAGSEPRRTATVDRRRSSRWRSHSGLGATAATIALRQPASSVQRGA